MRFLVAALTLLLATTSLTLWLLSKRFSIGIIPLGHETSLQIRDGGIFLRRVYAFGIAPAVPEKDWYSTATARGWTLPPPTPGFPGFSFHDGLVIGRSSGPGALISPSNFWLLRLPLWPSTLLFTLLAAWLLLKWHRSRQSTRRGFEVQTTPSTPHPAPAPQK